MSDISFDIIGRDRASAAFRNVGKAAQGADKQVTGFGASLKNHVGRFAALTGASLGAGALLGFAKSSIDTEAKFSTSMRLIKASSGATGDQMKQMNKLAVDLGIKTVYSANEAADAMLELSKAGISTKDIMRGAADGTLLLASAGGTSLTTAATIASNAMNAFNLKGKDMGKIAAALAGGANASSASVESLGLGLAQVGPGARNAGLSLQETVAALSAFDAAGIKGSDAGTSLKTMLTRLIPMTNKSTGAMMDLGLYSEKTGSAFVNANGTFKSLTQISGILHDKLGKLSQAQRSQAMAAIFGSDSTRAATVLMNDGAKGIGKYLKATNDQTAAQKMAKAAMGGTRGALEQLSGSIDTAKLKLGEALAPAVQKSANLLAANMVPAMDKALSAARQFGDVLKTFVVPPLKLLGTIVGDTPDSIKSLGIEVAIASLVFPRLASGVATATTAIKDQITYARVLRLEMAESAQSGTLFSSVVSKMGSVLKSAAGPAGMVALAESAKTSNASLSTLLSTAGGVATGFSVGGPWGAAIGGAIGLFAGLKKSYDATATAAQRNATILRKTSAAQVATASYDSLRATLNKATGAYTKNTKAAIENWLQTDKVGKAARAAAQIAGIGDRTLIAAVMGSPEANARIARSIQSQVDAATAKATALNNRMNALASNWFQAHPGAAGLPKEVTDQIDGMQKSIDILKDQRDALLGAKRALDGEGASLRKGARDQRNYFAATAAVNRLLHMTKKAYESTFSKRVRGELDLAGVPKTLAGIKAVANHVGGLTRKQWQVLVKAAGIDVTAKQLKNLVSTGKAAGKDTGAGYTSGAMAAIANSVMPMKKTATGVVTQATAAAKSAAFAGAHAVGTALDTGAAAGIRDSRGQVVAEARQTANAAIAEMRRAADSHSPSRKTIKLGRDIGAGLPIGLRASRGGAMSAGAQLIESLVKGIEHRKVRVKDVLGKLTDYIDKQTSKISGLMSKRQGIIDSFKGFSSSVFGATFQDAEGNDRTGTIDDLLAFQAQQRDQAKQVQADVASLIKNHVSASLLQQMENEGAAGLANIHTLAGASASQIAQFNALNAATNGALTATGDSVSGALGINGDIASAKRDEAVAERMADVLRKALREGQHQHMTVEVYLDGHQVHTVLLKERQKMRKPLGLD